MLLKGQVLHGTNRIAKILNALHMQVIFLFMATLVPSHLTETSLRSHLQQSNNPRLMFFGSKSKIFVDFLCRFLRSRYIQSVKVLYH